tara:strand:+ start:482 stop:802 length:321 start_codon:yes stop_codon:yes gene_type:complete
MIRKSFRMTLKDGKIDEYKKKHDEVWPEITEVLTKAGVKNYSIYYDKKDNALIEYMELEDNNTFHQLEELDILKKWNIYMKDLIETKSAEDATAIQKELLEVFHHD